MYEMWLVSELADKGNLLDALKAGVLGGVGPEARNMVGHACCTPTSVSAVFLPVGVC